MDDVIDYSPGHATDAGDRLGVMGDDGEKFGGWPTTWEHCWASAAADRFFTALEANAEWLVTTTPSAWLAEHPPIGRVYVPTGSYAEMGAWAPPPEEGRAFDKRPTERRTTSASRTLVAGCILAQLPGEVPRGRTPPQADAGDLRAGRGDAGGAGADRARDHLYQGQSNDCYWCMARSAGSTSATYGLANTWEHLIAAEELAETSAGSVVDAERRDLDLDGVDEIRLADEGQVAAGRPGRGRRRGFVGHLGRDIADGRRFMRRRPEAYHVTLRTPAAYGSSTSWAADPPIPAVEGAPVARAPTTHPRTAPRRRSMTRSGSYGSPAWPICWSTTPTSGARGLCASFPSKPPAADWAMARADELADLGRRRVRGRGLAGPADRAA